MEWKPPLTTKHHAAAQIQAEINAAEPPYFDSAIASRNNIWYMMEETPPDHWNRGDCYSFALLIQEALETIGIACTAGCVYASTNDGNAWDDQEYHPDHPPEDEEPWPLRFTDTPDENKFEGVAKLEEDGAWYYFGGAPAVQGIHQTDAGASIMLLRAYVLRWPAGKQEYYFWNGAYWEGTGVYEPLPPAP